MYMLEDSKDAILMKYKRVNYDDDVYGTFYLFLNLAFIICIAMGEITLIMNEFLLTITTTDGAHGWEISIATSRTILDVCFLVGGTVWLDMTRVVN